MMPQIRAEDTENTADIEMQFAVTAVQQANTYWRLCEALDPSQFHFTPIDDEIYSELLATFPQAEDDDNYFRILDEDAMKSEEGKKVWRKFCNTFEKKVEDYNFGTLLRIDTAGEYDEKNTMFAYRVQFYAIEIWRNRRGLNNWIHEAAKAEKAKSS